MSVGVVYGSSRSLTNQSALYLLQANLDWTGRVLRKTSGPVAVLLFESGLVSGKLFVGLRFAGFEKRDLQSRFRQAFARPSPGGPGTHNDDVVKVVLSLGHVVSVKNGC